MTPIEIAAALGLTRKRVWQLEASALAKIQALWGGEELDDGTLTEPEELRRLVAQCRNALRRIPKMPREVRHEI